MREEVESERNIVKQAKKHIEEENEPFVQMIRIRPMDSPDYLYKFHDYV